MTKAVLSAFAKIADREYLEVFGLDFEQLLTGQVFRHRPGITISDQDTTDECMDTFNAARVHYDAAYAVRSEFNRPLGVSTMTLQKVLGLTWKTFARKDRIVSFSSIQMIGPVFSGTTLYAESEVLNLEKGDQDCGLATVRTRAIDASGNELAILEYTVRVYRRGRHPYYGSLPVELEHVDCRFAAYREAEDGVLVEETGLYFEDLHVGESFHHQPSKIIEASEALEHARRAMEWNPRFTNPHYAREHFDEQSSPITESYSIGAVTALTTRTLGKVVANLAWKNVILNRLIYPGDLINVRTVITGARESHSRPTQGVLTVHTSATDHQKRDVISFERILLVYRRNAAPLVEGEC